MFKVLQLNCLGEKILCLDKLYVSLQFAIFFPIISLTLTLLCNKHQESNFKSK